MRFHGLQNSHRIALLIQTASEWSRSILKGIADFASERRAGWEFFIEARGPLERLRIPRGWDGDGIIARVDHPALARAILRCGKPAVNVSWLGLEWKRIPHVVSDQVACGRLAARHFQDQGLRSFGYVGPLDAHRYWDELGRQFALTTQESGFDCRLYTPEQAPSLESHLGRWLKEVPKPIGILAWNDARCQDVLTACAGARLEVPDDVAILSAEHDSIFSSLSSMPFSSLDMAPVKIGFEAAALLQQLLAGRKRPASPLLIPPAGIIQRQSTETAAVDDRDLASALRFIRDNAFKPIQVSDVVQALPLSRRALEERFLRILGRAPAEEIRRVRLERVKRLLCETDWPIPEIAEKTGFNHVEVMIRSFGRQFGITPGEFRLSR